MHKLTQYLITCFIYSLEQSHTCLIYLCLFAFYLDKNNLFIGFRVCTSNCFYFANSLLINLTVYSWPPVNLQFLFTALIYAGLLILLQH